MPCHVKKGERAIPCNIKKEGGQSLVVFKGSWLLSYHAATVRPPGGGVRVRVGVRGRGQAAVTSVRLSSSMSMRALPAVSYVITCITHTLGQVKEKEKRDGKEKIRAQRSFLGSIDRDGLNVRVRVCFKTRREKNHVVLTRIEIRRLAFLLR